MAFDESLTLRLRAALGNGPDLSEKRMMGGVCFFRHGNMVCGADRSKQGERRFMFRVGKGNEAAATLPEGVPMVLGEPPEPEAIALPKSAAVTVLASMSSLKVTV